MNNFTSDLRHFCYNSRVLVKAMVFAAVITVRPLAHEDVLEPSVANEVEHAIARAPTNAPPSVLLPLATSGLARVQLAIRLVSAQGADGRWTVGTNDVTATAVRLLRKTIE